MHDCGFHKDNPFNIVIVIITRKTNDVFNTAHECF
jgi:hypothetical protein